MPSRKPTVLLGFLLPWTWGISSQLLQQSTATAPYLELAYLLTAAATDLGHGVSPRSLTSPVGHILSELSIMTRPPWVALHGMAHSFIELDKAVVHVISLISFLSFWFSFCLPSVGEG